MDADPEAYGALLAALHDVECDVERAWDVLFITGSPRLQEHHEPLCNGLEAIKSTLRSMQRLLAYCALVELDNPEVALEISQEGHKYRELMDELNYLIKVASENEPG